MTYDKSRLNDHARQAHKTTVEELEYTISNPTIKVNLRPDGSVIVTKVEETKGCELCGDIDGPLFLQARCHPSAPLKAIKEGSTLILRCYIPECDREVVRLKLDV